MATAADVERAPRHALREMRISGEPRDAMRNLQLDTEFTVPGPVASRMATAWAESIDGSMDGVEAWSHLGRYRSRLLLAPVPEGVHRNAALKRSLQRWEQGRVNDLEAHLAGQKVEAERKG